MRYVLGVDGGGTKTTVALATEQGRVVDMLQAGCTNHQICGLTEAQRVIAQGAEVVLARNGVKPENVIRAVMGLAGADFEGDVARLSAGLSGLLPSFPLEILNDVWLPLAAQAPEGNAAVSICGTGHNTAVRTREGTRFSIAALTYTLGNFGGGRMLTKMGLHAGFRAHEGTGEDTRLRERLPGLFSVASMQALLETLYQQGEAEAYDAPVPQLVFALAQEGDGVSRHLLEVLGSEQGRMTGGLLQKAGIADSRVHVVLAGSLYTNGQAEPLVEAYRRSLKSQCPGVELSLLECDPIVGALGLALVPCGKGLSTQDTERRMENLRQTCLAFLAR